LAYFAVFLSGLMDLMAVLVGAPYTGRFWIVFAACLSICAPVVFLLQRLIRDAARAGAQLAAADSPVTKCKT
jgi:hypothetical protein